MKTGVQHARQQKREERAFHEYWERRQKERERRKEERDEPSTKIDTGKVRRD